MNDEPWTSPARTADEFLHRAGWLIRQRGEERDQPNGERSMARTVEAFNALTGQRLSTVDGWLFMAVLKLARGTDRDSLEDGVAYAALRAEAWAQEDAE